MQLLDIDIPNDVIQNKNKAYNQIKKYIEDYTIAPKDYDEKIVKVIQNQEGGWDAWEGKGYITVKGEHYDIIVSEEYDWIVNRIVENKIYLKKDDDIDNLHNRVSCYKRKDGNLELQIDFNMSGSILTINISPNVTIQETPFSTGSAAYEFYKKNILGDSMANIKKTILKGRIKSLTKLFGSSNIENYYKHKVILKSSDKEIEIVYLRSYQDSKTHLEKFVFLNYILVKKFTKTFTNDLENEVFLKLMTDNQDLHIAHFIFCHIENLPDFIRRGENGELEYLFRYIKKTLIYLLLT